MWAPCPVGVWIFCCGRTGSLAIGLYVVAGGWWTCAVSVDLRVVVVCCWCCCRPVTAAAAGPLAVGFCNTDNGMRFDQRLQLPRLQRVVGGSAWWAGGGGGDGGGVGSGGRGLQFRRVIWRIFVYGRIYVFAGWEEKQRFRHIVCMLLLLYLYRVNLIHCFLKNIW